MIDATVLFLMLVNQYHVSPPQAATMVCLAIHESRLNPKAVNADYNSNGTTDYGLFQINSIWIDELNIDKEHLLTTKGNIKVALHIYKYQGPKAWSTLKKCVH